MAKVIVSLTMSLDGFIAGPNDDFDHPVGTRNGVKLFDWYTSGTGPGVNKRREVQAEGEEQEVVEEMFMTAGASFTGRRTYDIAGGWIGKDDVADAVKVAKAAAGDKDVGVAGASVAPQCLKAGLVDEIYIHIAPMLLGDGVRLFDHLGDDSIDLEFIDAITSTDATHLRYRVRR